MPLVLVAPFEGWTQLLMLDFDSSAELDVEVTDAPGLPLEEVEMDEEEWMVFE